MKFKIFAKFFIVTMLISCSSDTGKQMTIKKFRDPDNTAVFTTKFITIDKKVITRVTHEKEDGAWQFFSDDNFDSFEDVAKVVGLGEVIKIDSTVLELADMQKGYFATRQTKGDKWVVNQHK
ncbi:hypothetical protein QWZ08_16405 [Ferruginibacter paludis]|uniref:hypothetical protein n=1 Tax=Ferruginibacter paludis TaxID=1310417 RepID=UPI0025B3B1EE|nr:hypothetical protein [Ferruginibacter paludis]MDN3657233.1 hypothetical protein [Ferruginibacter paludis]